VPSPTRESALLIPAAQPLRLDLPPCRQLAELAAVIVFPRARDLVAALLPVSESAGTAADLELQNVQFEGT